jgi:energy-coupling factor transporter ATP-binding protein EcfA2
MTAVLEARGLGKRYRRLWALADCALSIPAGRVVGLVGPNGAGKTTLLTLAAGLLAPTTGMIEVLGGRPRPPWRGWPGWGSWPRTLRSMPGCRLPIISPSAPTSTGAGTRCRRATGSRATGSRGTGPARSGTATGPPGTALIAGPGRWRAETAPCTGTWRHEADLPQSLSSRHAVRAILARISPVGSVSSMPRVFRPVRAGGRRCCGAGGEVSGPAQGAGGAVGVPGLQIFWVAGHAGDRGHVGVVSGGVWGYLCEQRQRPQTVVVGDRLACGGEAEGGAGLAPGSVGAVGGADAGAYACREPGRVHGGGQDDAHVGERCRLHRAGRADQAGDLEAGVPVELHQWPGTFHGSQAILSAEVSQRQNAELAAALRRALAD